MCAALLNPLNNADFEKNFSGKVKKTNASLRLK